jgi:hypothetical protein
MVEQSLMEELDPGAIQDQHTFRHHDVSLLMEIIQHGSRRPQFLGRIHSLYQHVNNLLPIINTAAGLRTTPPLLIALPAVEVLKTAYLRQVGPSADHVHIQRKLQWHPQQRDDGGWNIGSRSGIGKNLAYGLLIKLTDGNGDGSIVHSDTSKDPIVIKIELAAGHKDPDLWIAQGLDGAAPPRAFDLSG